jgi:hypothetical protein
MTHSAASLGAQGAVAAFDRMAGSYDGVFTESAVGRERKWATGSSTSL